MSIGKQLFSLGVSAIALLFSAQAMAQDAPVPDKAGDGAGVGDIVVTANRQFSGDDLRQAGATDSADLAQLVPGVYVAGAYGGQSQQYTIRGVTQSDYLDTIENPVAFYIDDVYITSAQGQTMSFFDIDRVEILKGPQGTLFGRNATGGLAHNIVAKPKLNDLGGYVDLSYARFNEVNTQGALNRLAKTPRFVCPGCTPGSIICGRTDIRRVALAVIQYCRLMARAATLLASSSRQMVKIWGAMKPLPAGPNCFLNQLTHLAFA
jgi:hypothetical protein